MLQVHQWVLKVATRGQGLIDISARVQEVVDKADVTMGLCVVFIQHTSASLVIQENAAPSVRRDMQKWIAGLAPESDVYEHDDEGPDDMPGHLRSTITRTSESIPITNGQLALGTWQAIYVWEHRHAEQTRQVVVHVQGVRGGH